MGIHKSSAAFILLPIVTEPNFYCFMRMSLMLTQEGELLKGALEFKTYSVHSS